VREDTRSGFFVCGSSACWRTEEGNYHRRRRLEKGSRARASTDLVYRGDFSPSRSFFFPVYSLSLPLSLSHTLRSPGGPPPRGRRGTTTRGRFNQERNVSRGAQCRTGRAWTISRKVRTAGRNAVAKRNLCVAVSPSRSLPFSLSLFLPLSLSLSLSPCPVLDLATALGGVASNERNVRESHREPTSFFPQIPSLSLLVSLGAWCLCGAAYPCARYESGAQDENARLGASQERTRSTIPLLVSVLPRHSRWGPGIIPYNTEIRVRGEIPISLYARSLCFAASWPALSSSVRRESLFFNGIQDSRWPTARRPRGWPLSSSPRFALLLLWLRAFTFSPFP